MVNNMLFGHIYVVIIMIRETIRKQCQSKINLLIDFKGFKRPKEGWVRTLRKTIGMNSPQRAVRLGVSKSQASQMERMESRGSYYIKTA